MTYLNHRQIPRPLRAARNLAYRVAVLVTQMDRLEAAFRGLDAQQQHLSERFRGFEAQQQHLLDRLHQDHQELLGVLEANHQQNLEVLEVLRDAEPATRRFLWEVRERPTYDTAFTEAEPLVTVVIPTYTNVKLLVERALPSVFAQTYERLEIVIVGDAASPEVEAAIRRVGDPRIRYANLPYRGPYPDERRLRWMVAGGPPVNEGVRLAKGRWLAFMDDDDACTPNRIELLLQAARDHRWEFCYGRIRRHDPNGPEVILCEFPPTAPGTVGKSASILHSDLRFFTGELSDALFGNVGDWARINRMMRVGVRMGMIPDVVLDYYPNRLWGDAPW